MPKTIGVKGPLGRAAKNGAALYTYTHGCGLVTVVTIVMIVVLVVVRLVLPNPVQMYCLLVFK